MGFADLRWSILSGYGPLFLQGLQMTLWLTAVSLIGGLALGIVLGLISSTSDSPPPRTRAGVLAWQLLRGATRAYVGFFRGTPLFVQILLVHFALMPMLVQPEGGLLLSGEAARAFRQDHGAFFSGALALTLNAGAYSRYWEPYLLISAVYLVITLTLSALARRLEAPAHLRGR